MSDSSWFLSLHFLVTSSVERCGMVDMLSFSNVSIDFSAVFPIGGFAVDQFALLYIFLRSIFTKMYVMTHNSQCSFSFILFSFSLN